MAPPGAVWPQGCPDPSCDARCGVAASVRTQQAVDEDPGFPSDLGREPAGQRRDEAERERQEREKEVRRRMRSPKLSYEPSHAIASMTRPQPIMIGKAKRESLPEVADRTGCS